MKNYFDTEQDALDYKAEHGLVVRVPVFLSCRRKWALVFPIKCHVTVADGGSDEFRSQQ